MTAQSNCLSKRNGVVAAYQTPCLVRFDAGNLSYIIHFRTQNLVVTIRGTSVINLRVRAPLFFFFKKKKKKKKFKISSQF